VDTPKKAPAAKPRIRPRGNRSPLLRPAEGGSGAANPAPAPEGAVLPSLDELALGGPPPPAVAAASPVEAPALPPPGGQPVAEYEEPPDHGPLIAGLIACGAVLLLGGIFLFWRNRDSRYWPA